jgi:MoaA/NifB/PqqE/SkfB family radical SAM enzyme
VASSLGWAELDSARKGELLEAICDGRATRGPVHVELDLTDRCNAACSFCNQQDLRTRRELPLARVTELVDELAVAGLKAVRLSGGGDPLVHRDIAGVLDHLAGRGIVVDNVTTNGIALDADIARRLVRQRAREVIVSLNTVGADDHLRLMGVGGRYQRVLDNLRRLVAERGARRLPAIVIQFLLDRDNLPLLPQMVALADDLGVDRAAVNVILQVPNRRLEEARLLGPADVDAVRLHLRDALERDRGCGRLQLCFPFPEWNRALAELQSELGVEVWSGFETAPSFCDANGQCFFSWYSAAISATGDVVPCCMLLNPGYTPLGNVERGSFLAQWHGRAFARMRAEQRDVLLTGGRIAHRPGRFQVLSRACVEPHLCGLKTLFFRGDEAFYRALAAALAPVRRREVGWLGVPPQVVRRAEVAASESRLLRGVYRRVRHASLGLRQELRSRYGVTLFAG